MKLTKKKIAVSLQAEFGLSSATSKEVIEHIFSLMEKALKNGGSVVFNKIGTLEPVELEARTHKGFNKVFSVPSMRKVKFTQSKVLEVSEVGELKTTKNLTPKKSVQLDDVDPEVEEMRKIFSRLQ